MRKTRIDIPQENITYSIMTSNDIFSSIQQEVKDYEEKRFLVVTDDNIYRIYTKQILSGAEKLSAEILVLEHGEKNKNMKSVNKILNTLMKNSFTRKDYVVALGGGVIGDVTGLAGALFKRGINVIQIPTTLLSMCDSSVGGKTGVDHLGVKNGIGSFFNPKLVLIDSNFLKTLRSEDILGGYFEGLKHAILQGEKDYIEYEKFRKLLESKQYENINKIIFRNIEYKLSVAAGDPTETNGKRRILNYGHTFGHAIEAYLDFKVGHGICVGLGILFANIFSYKIGLLKEDTKEKIETFIRDLGPAKEKLRDIDIPKLDFGEIYPYMTNDKKNEKTNVKFILLKDFGKVTEYDTSKVELRATFDLFTKRIGKY